MTEILIANNACITRYRNLVSLLDDVSHANNTPVVARRLVVARTRKSHQSTTTTTTAELSAAQKLILRGRFEENFQGSEKVTSHF